MPFNIYSDGEVLTALDLNEDNNTSLDINTATPQTVVAVVTFGGLLTQPLTVGALATFGGATVNHINTLTSGTTYAIAATDCYVMVNTGAAMAITLPSVPTTGRTISIKDVKGTAGTLAITITPTPTTMLIDGVSHYTISSNFGSVTLMFTGLGWSSV